MITPLSWLERVPSFKDQQEQLREKDLATYGFLGYPLLQSADVLVYRPAYVPVGEDQVAHVEIAREIARRFNNFYGREPDFELKAERAIKELGGRNITLYRQLRKQFQEKGDAGALERARNLVNGNTRITVADRERLLGYLEGNSVSILAEPQALLTATPRVPGTRRPQDVQVVRQYDRAARGPGQRGAQAQGHADRPGARAAHRPGRSGQVPGIRVAPHLLRRGHAQLGGARAAAAPASAAWNASSP